MHETYISLPEYTQSDEEYTFSQDEVDQLREEFRVKGHDFFELIAGRSPNKYRIRTKFWVGSIRLNQNYTLIVKPRYGPDSFLKMLTFIDDDLMILFEDFSHFNPNEGLLIYIVKIFLKKTKALFEENKWRSYEDVMENRSTIKGHIKVKENLVYNKFLKDKIFCSFSEYSLDNKFNQIIKFALFKLFQIVEDPSLILELKSIYSILDNISLKQFDPIEINQLSYNRLNEAYKPVHKLCKLFIENIFISHSIGNRDFYCFFLNMYDLFEKFVRNILKKFSKFTVLGQPIDKYRDENKQWRIEPDIRILENNTETLILDVKYKEDLINTDKSEIESYIRGYNLQKGVLIYPNVNINTNPIKIPNLIIYLKKIDLNHITPDYLKKFAHEIDDLVG